MGDSRLPNRAASSFLSAILREPLLGLEAELPVTDDFTAWVASPLRAVDWLAHAGGSSERRRRSRPGVLALASTTTWLGAVSSGSGPSVPRRSR